MNVIDFILYGDTDAKTRAGIVVDSLDAQPKFKVEEGKGTSFMDVRETEVDDSNVKAIEKCIQEWRAGTIKPVYIHFAEPTIVSKREWIFASSFVVIDPSSQRQGRQTTTPATSD